MEKVCPAPAKVLSTGATASRRSKPLSGGPCAREFGKRFGDTAYAREELVAELGAAFLCAALGITPEPRDDHASYLDHCLQVLKADKRAIFSAAAHAQKAAEYLHSLKGSHTERWHRAGGTPRRLKEGTRKGAPILRAKNSAAPPGAPASIPEQQCAPALAGTRAPFPTANRNLYQPSSSISS
jgi:Zincin-like metallopeptidase